MKINWFKHETAFYFDGYPRSGNTYLQMLIKNVFERVDTVHHFHSIGSLKIAIDKKLPVFILYRNPKDAITSNYLKEYSLKNQIDAISEEQQDYRLLMYFLKYYISYHQNISKFQNNIKLISFDKLINQPEDVLISINKILPKKHKKNISTINNIVAEVKNIEFGAKDTFGSSKPNKTKEKYKNKLKKILDNYQELELANNIYQKIKTAHNNI